MTPSINQLKSKNVSKEIQWDKNNLQMVSKTIASKGKNNNHI